MAKFVAFKISKEHSTWLNRLFPTLEYNKIHHCGESFLARVTWRLQNIVYPYCQKLRIKLRNERFFTRKVSWLMQSGITSGCSCCCYAFQCPMFPFAWNGIGEYLACHDFLYITISHVGRNHLQYTLGWNFRILIARAWQIQGKNWIE